MKMKLMLTVLLLFCLEYSYAGEHYSRKDDFTGETHLGFTSTDKEFTSDLVTYLITDYNSKLNHLGFYSQPLAALMKSITRVIPRCLRRGHSFFS
jgi:hypothetical protein